MKKSHCGRLRLFRLIATWAAITALSSAGARYAAAATDVLVFAAASTSGAIEDLAQSYAARGLGAVSVAFAGSATLARQIAAGAPADIYISAHPRWMDYLAARNALESGTRKNLVGNRLVVVTPKDNPMEVRLQENFSLVSRMNGRPLAMGDPDHVPAGIYAKVALEALGLWRAVADHIAPMHHVRAALVLVERGEAAAGIVYATDAAVSSLVSVAATFPAASHPPIVYTAAIVGGRDRPEVRRFFAFLTSADAMTIFARHGFSGIPRLEH